MKLFFLLLLTILFSEVFAQQIKIGESTSTFSVGSKPCISLVIPYANVELASDALKSLMKDWGKHKSSKGEHVVLQGSSKTLGAKPFDAYATISEEKNGESTTIYFAVDLGGAFLTKKDHADQYQLWNKRLQEFGVKTASESVSIELATANEELKNLNSDQKKLEKDLQDYQSEIEKLKKQITDNEKKIEENKKDQGVKTNEIKTQETKVNAIEKKKKSIN